MVNLSRRIWAPELMDAPDCDSALLLRTLEQFRWINRLTARYRTLLAQTVLRDMQRAREREYHLVDIGAGGCDIPAWLLARSRRLGLKLRITALDTDPRTVAWATQRHACQAGLTVVQASAADLTRFAPVDYVFANHFLHHLPDDETIRGMLELVHQTAQRGYLLTDIRRSVLAYAGVTCLMGVFFRRSFALPDGLLSVRKAFTVQELQNLLPAGAAVQGARVLALRPARLAIVGGMAFST